MRTGFHRCPLVARRPPLPGELSRHQTPAGTWQIRLSRHESLTIDKRFFLFLANLGLFCIFNGYLKRSLLLKAGNKNRLKTRPLIFFLELASSDNFREKWAFCKATYFRLFLTKMGEILLYFIVSQKP